MNATIDALNAMKIVLASKSPRRVELLNNLGLKFTIVPSQFPETLDKSQITAENYVILTAQEKALQVYRTLLEQLPTSPPDLVIGADTVVVLANEILEKPENDEHAVAMLKRLRDSRTHSVITGVCLVLYRPQGPNVITFAEHTTVSFGNVSDSIIQDYVATKDPLDKAGAYGYQSKAMHLIERIDGCFYNVVGLPVHRLFSELQQII